MMQNKEDRGYHRLRFSALFWNVKSNGDLFVCLFVLSLFGLYQKATLGRKWSFWVTVEHYIKERCCSLRQDISPVWKYLGTTVVFSCQYSFCEYLPGTYSAMHAPWCGVYTCFRELLPQGAQGDMNWLRNHGHRGRMATTWTTLATCAAWPQGRDSPTQLSGSEMTVQKRRCGTAPW